MVFIKHKKGRKDQGITSASQTVKCYKCGNEIEMGEIFYSKASHSKYSNRTTGYICESCYQSFVYQRLAFYLKFFPLHFVNFLEKKLFWLS